ncbi:hypothetical protein GCM10010420_55670 [Streptomyces glaucosporus]|uniref:Uncharacterized protein n=1 Tax=Streptomyces glaucosporus TaxID=284044 RepID=A0ABN3J132_9ACTN
MSSREIAPLTMRRSLGAGYDTPSGQQHNDVLCFAQTAVTAVLGPVWDHTLCAVMNNPSSTERRIVSRSAPDLRKRLPR